MEGCRNGERRKERRDADQHDPGRLEIITQNVKRRGDREKGGRGERDFSHGLFGAIISLFQSALMSENNHL